MQSYVVHFVRHGLTKANINGKFSLSFDFKGMLYFSSIENIDIKSISKENENPKISGFLYMVLEVSEHTLSTFIPCVSSIVLNIHKYPNDDMEKEYGAGNPSHTTKSDILFCIRLYR